MRAAEALPGPQLFGHFLPQKLGQTARLELGRIPQTMAVTSLSVMLAAVIPSPAGIGSTEFVFTALFSGIVGTGLAGSASLLYRFGTFVFPFLVGAVVVIIRRIYLKKTRQAKL